MDIGLLLHMLGVAIIGMFARIKTGASAVCIRIKQSKTDPFRKGIDLHVGKTGSVLCPVAALLNYLVIRGKEKGLLFRFRPLTRQRFH